MPPKGRLVNTRKAPMRLQTINKLRIRSPNQQTANPCIAVMSSVLNCWASSKFSVEGCASVEQQLRACMDERRPQATNKSTINYHLMRMFPKISGPRKKD